MQALARDYKNERGLFEWFCDRALHDPFVRTFHWQQNPRQTALQALLPEVKLPLGLERDRPPSSRPTLIPKGIWQFFDRKTKRSNLKLSRLPDPRVLEILRDRADNDPDEQLREFARQALNNE